MSETKKRQDLLDIHDHNKDGSLDSDEAKAGRVVEAIEGDTDDMERIRKMEEEAKQEARRKEIAKKFAEDERKQKQEAERVRKEVEKGLQKDEQEKEQAVQQAEKELTTLKQDAQEGKLDDVDVEIKHQSVKRRLESKLGSIKQGSKERQAANNKRVGNIRDWGKATGNFALAWTAAAPFRLTGWTLKKIDHLADWGLHKIEEWGKKNIDGPVSKTLTWAFDWTLWPLEKMIGRQTVPQAEEAAKGARGDQKETEKLKKANAGKEKKEK